MRTIDTKTKYGKYSIESMERKLHLHAMLHGCGFEKITDPNYFWDNNRRGYIGFAIWQYTISGFGEFVHDGKVYQVHPGEAMLLEVPQNSTYYLPKKSTEWEFIYLNLYGGELMRLWHELSAKTGPLIKFQKKSTAVNAAWEIINRQSSGSIKTPFEASALAYNFTMHLINEFLSETQSENLSFINQTTTFAVENMHKSIGIEDLAENSGYSRFHFSRLFKKHYGVSPSVFLRNLRIQRAVRMLQNELLMVKDIGEHCGFPDSSYFCKVFKKEMGISPEQFRHSNKSSTMPSTTNKM